MMTYGVPLGLKELTELILIHYNINDSVKDCSIFIANTQKIPQYNTKPLIYSWMPLKRGPSWHEIALQWLRQNINQRLNS